MYAGVGRLGGLAHDLHDVVPLALVPEVVADELERVAKGRDGGEAHLEVLLLLARSLDDGGEDGVGVGDEASAQVGVLRLADVADGSQRRLLLVRHAIADVLNERRHQVVPLAAGQLDGGDGRYDLGGGVAGLRVGRGQGLERELLDPVFRLVVGALQPFSL